MIRLTFLLRRKSDLTLAEFQDYWRRHHGPLVAGFGAALQARRYVQVHTLDDPGQHRHGGSTGRHGATVRRCG